MKAAPETNTKIKQRILLDVEYIENNYVKVPKKWPLGRSQSVVCSVMFTGWNKL